MGEQVLVLCSDTRVTIPNLASNDNATKLETIGPLRILIADNAARAKELLAVITEHVNEEKIADDSTVGKLKAAATTHKRNLLDEYFGLTWGVDYNGYLAGTLNHLPEDVLSRIAREVEQLHFECQLIITAHTKTGFRLFTMDSRGTILEADDYVVIGSGLWIAQASLGQRQYSRYHHVSLASYLIYEAKRLAENEPTVGKTTNMWLIHHRHAKVVPAFINGSCLQISPSGISTQGPDVFEKLFGLYGPQRLPVEIPFPVLWPTAVPEVPLLEEHTQTNVSGTAASGGSRETEK
jgi:20S proteasome alpha/beta subunit